MFHPTVPTGRRLALGPVLALATLGAPGVQAEGPGEAERALLDPSLPPLTALPTSDAPGATTLITAEEIERSGAANIFELLRRVPGVDVRYTPMGGHIGIRGTGVSPFSEQVLLLVDGSPYNSPDKGGFPGHPNYAGYFPLHRIARIEVVRGPVSVLYGANAFGGVINIVTKTGLDRIADRVQGAAIEAAAAGGTRELVDRRVTAALVRGGWEASASAQWTDGRTPIHMNGDASHGVSNVHASARRGNFRASLLHTGSRNGSFAFEGLSTRPAHHTTDVLDAHYERQVGGTTLRGAATYNRYRGTTCAVCHNAGSAHPDDAVTAEVGDEREEDQRLRLALRADRALTDGQDLIVGVEAAADRVQRDIVKQPGAPDTLDSAGGYVQHQWRLPAAGLRLLTGVRLDHAEALGTVGSPRVALVAEPTGGLLLRGSWARAWRAPTWNERFLRQRFLPEDLAPGLVLLNYGNPDLERERVDAVEVGASWRVLPSAVLSLDLYRNRIEGFIEREDATFVPGSGGGPDELRLIWQNRDDPFRILGGELVLDWRPTSDLDLNVGWAWRDVGLPVDDAAAAYAPRSRLVLSGGWTPGPYHVDLSASTSSRYRVSAPSVFGQRPQPAYEIVDLAVGRSWGIAGARLDLKLSGRNVLDEQVWETRIDDALDTRLRGRSFALELRAEF